MTQVEVELHDDVIAILNKIKNINDQGIELIIPEGAVILENVVNLKLLKARTEDANKSIHFLTNDIQGQTLIKNIEGVANDEFDLDVDQIEEATVPEDTEYLKPKVRRKTKFVMPNIKVKVPKLASLAIIGALLIFGYIGINILKDLPNANIKIVVNSQPLTKSISVKVQANGSTNKDQKTLKGDTVEVTFEESVSAKTTGKKMIGEKASGEIKIFNKTDQDKEFKEGTEIIYEKDDTEYKYEITDDVTVPARTFTPDPNDPNIGTYKNGEENVEVLALQIGDNYNIDKGTTLKISKQNTTNFSATVEKDIDGGIEEELQVVAQEDLTKLKADIAKKISDKGTLELEKVVKPGQKVIKGSEKSTVSTDVYDKKVGDEAEEVKLTQKVTLTALAYSSKELDILMDELVKEFIPEGFVLSTKERSVNVEILGNATSSVLTSTQADIQVTLKTFVVPDVTEESLFDQIKGKSVEETQKILGSIRNVKTYEFNLSPKIPFMSRVPTVPEKVHIIIERE